MTFLSPERLWLLAGVAGLLAAYLILARRRRQYAVRFTNLDLLASLAPRRPGWRRHLPAAATLGALVFLVVGFARPARPEQVAREEATVVVALDVSLSMEATDVAPNRLDAARRAATDFVDDLPDGIRLGLVTFDATARVLVPPATDRTAVTAAIERLELGPGTATGEGVFAALSAVGPRGEGAPPARIVVMSDGTQTVGRPPQLAAKAARAAGVPVSTIAFGTDEGWVSVQGEPVPVPVDRPAMQALADDSGGEFFEAASGDELRRIYAGIGSQVGFVTEQREVTASVVGAALALLALAGAGSLLWSARLP